MCSLKIEHLKNRAYNLLQQYARILYQLKQPEKVWGELIFASIFLNNLGETDNVLFSYANDIYPRFGEAITCSSSKWLNLAYRRLIKNGSCFESVDFQSSDSDISFLGDVFILNKLEIIAYYNLATNSYQLHQFDSPEASIFLSNIANKIPTIEEMYYITHFIFYLTSIGRDVEACEVYPELRVMLLKMLEIFSAYSRCVVNLDLFTEILLCKKLLREKINRNETIFLNKFYDIFFQGAKSLQLDESFYSSYHTLFLLIMLINVND